MSTANVEGLVSEPTLREYVDLFQDDLRAIIPQTQDGPAMWLTSLWVRHDGDGATYVMSVAHSLPGTEAARLADETLAAFRTRLPGPTPAFRVSLDPYRAPVTGTPQMRRQRDRAMSFLAAYTADRRHLCYRDGEQILWLDSVELADDRGQDDDREEDRRVLVAKFCVEYSYDEGDGQDFADAAVHALLASDFAPALPIEGLCMRFR